MQGLFIVGSARSGASVVAGLLAKSGIVADRELYRPSPLSPHGGLESLSVLEVNEALLAAATPPEQLLLDGQHWLARLDSKTQLQSSSEIQEEIKAHLTHPFCLKDPRLVWTLPHWVQEATDAQMVCVFRSPVAAAHSVVQACKAYPELDRPTFGLAEAYDLWIEAHERILRELQTCGRWHFMHLDQCFSEEGLDRLQEFTGTELNRSFGIEELRACPMAQDAPKRAQELYSELCSLARYEPRALPPTHELPHVAVLIPTRDHQRAKVSQQIAWLKEQRGVRAEIIVVDQTTHGDLQFEGARVIRVSSPSPGAVFQQALEATDAPCIAWQDPEVQPLPQKLARLHKCLALNPGALLCTSNLALTQSDSCFGRQLALDLCGDEPHGFWQSSLLFRRKALESMEQTCFAGVELAHYQTLLQRGQVAHLGETLACVPESLFTIRDAWERQSAKLMRLSHLPSQQDPTITVLMASHNRKAALLECIEGFCRQELPPGTLELIVIDDGSTDGTQELFRHMELPVQLRFIEQENHGAASARNNGMPEARGEWILFVNDDTIPFPDTVRGHIEAHRELTGQQAVVLGTFEQPTEECEQNLTRLLEATTHCFAYSSFTTDVDVGGGSFYTCNISLSKAAIEQVGLFDQTFPMYAEDTDYGLRLEDAGYRIHYRPEIRAIHRHVLPYETIVRRQYLVSKAHVHLYKKHPRTLGPGWGVMTVKDLEARLAGRKESMLLAEPAARTLAKVNLKALEDAGDYSIRSAKGLERSLDNLFTRLNNCWWEEGLLEGIKCKGVSGFPELLGHSMTQLLAWPNWTSEQALRELACAMAPLVGRRDACLVLRLDPVSDGDPQTLLAKLQAISKEVHGKGGKLDVRVELSEESPKLWAQLALDTDGLLQLPGALQRPPAWHGAIDLPVLQDANALQGWLENRTQDAPSTELHALRGNHSMHNSTDLDSDLSNPRLDPDPLVSVLAIIGENDQEHIDQLLESLQTQQGVSTEILLVDQTQDRNLTVRGVRIVQCSSVSRAVQWHAALAESTGSLIAWIQPGCRPLANHLENAVKALNADAPLDLVTCDYYLHNAQGQFVQRIHPDQMGEVPGPFWESGVVMRREVLASMAKTAFHPVELELWQKHRANRLIGHVQEPGFSVDQESYETARTAATQDAALLALGQQPFVGMQPELTVSICSFNRRDVLVECLEAFSRQLLPKGTFEIVLVNDGSSDGTLEMLEDLELPVPTRILHQDNGGLSAARNTGIAVSTGRLILFVNDDTIPDPDCIGEHLRAHATFAPGVRGAVLGLFSQPEACLRNALLRYLESSTEVFNFATLEPEAFHPISNFYTCNVSVSLDAVREAGSFDPSFRHYGCEDTDLALRLGELGYDLFYQPKACAIHRHVMDFDYIRNRQHTVAQAYVRLFRKHPKLLMEWNIQDLSARDCHRIVTDTAEPVACLEAAAKELSGLNVHALESLGGEFAEIAQCAMEDLARIVAEVNLNWWHAGYLTGFREHRLSGFSELVSLDPTSSFVQTKAQRRLLAWPRWHDTAELDRLMGMLESVAQDGFCALILRHDPGRDIDRQTALDALQVAYQTRFPSLTTVPLEVLVESRPLTRSEHLQLSLAVNALLVLGGESREFLQLIGTERLTTPCEVASWRQRFEPPIDTLAVETIPQAPAQSAPELTVVIPTHDRPRELVQLIEKLNSQDLEAKRFEVLVVDDASRQPAAEVLAEVNTRFALRVLRQEASGPGAARNLGVEHALGKIIVFFNDDAVPAKDNLYCHLQAHRSRTEQLPVMGTFSLLPEFQVDSFGAHVESSRILFGQPLMRTGVLYAGLTLCTGNLSIPKQLLDSVGGFDERFPYAGGEDSELGIRLERMCGTQVLFDDRIRCEHDHALDIQGYLQRMHIIGWASYRIDLKHPNSTLLTDTPSTPQQWIELAQQVERDGPMVSELVEALMDMCHLERTKGLGSSPTEEFRQACSDIGTHGFRAGLIAAHAGRLPVDCPAQAAPRMAS